MDGTVLSVIIISGLIRLILKWFYALNQDTLSFMFNRVNTQKTGSIAVYGSTVYKDVNVCSVTLDCYMNVHG